MINQPAPPPQYPELDQALASLAANRERWVNTPVAERISILATIKECLMPVAQAWVETAARHKGIAPGSPLVGEEWTAGPYTLLNYCNEMMFTLGKVDGKHHLDDIPLRRLSNGQIVARTLPRSFWDRLLLSGVTVDVWMQPGVDQTNLKQYSASIYDPASSSHKTGKLALVLGAGNVASIAPLDVFQKLFSENQVVILKMNPVNDYLIEFLIPALQPLIQRGVLHIVRGAADIGQYLCTHRLVEEIHITGAGASHDAIVWGSGAEGHNNKASGTPNNSRTITSELGAVCPTIVVPGPWSQADLAFQAEQVATQKLHNSGFNCVACQVLIMPAEWNQKNAFLAQLRHVIGNAESRALYYPGTEERLAQFAAAHPGAASIRRQNGAPVLIAQQETNTGKQVAEVFAPALGITELPGDDAETFLRTAIDYANDHLYGTLGANIVIHPATIAQLGRARLESMLIGLRYGTIAINAWTGLAFMTPQATWGAYPGHTLADVQSGIGIVHNTLLFERPERTVVEAPFKPFPRNLFSFSFSLLPRPPWFITNRRAHILGKLLVDFQYRPGLLKMMRIFLHALLS